MSQISGGQPRRSGTPDIYTVLVVIAALALLVAIAFVVVKNRALTGSSNPFAVLSLAKPWIVWPGLA